MEKKGEIRTPERKGVIFLVFQNGKILLEDRITPGKAYFGYRIIPGGKVEGQEPFEEAARRELLEECGIIPLKMIKLDNFLCMTISNQLYRTSAYLVTEFEGEVVNREDKSKHMWADLNEARELMPFAESRYVLEMAKNALISEGLIGG